MTAEEARLKENAQKEVPLELWGPYLSERQWGTVREDYSDNGDAWNYFSHDQARSRAYRWGEDGIAGICDYNQRLCFSVALWNGQDPILKERLFGVTNGEGNHGEDVKELYYYLDNLPSHYYMQYLYKYPQVAFPYVDLLEQNKQRTKLDPEYEILDTGVFTDDRYFDVLITYAKQSSTDIFIRIAVTNRSAYPAPVTLLPTLWFHNDWQYEKDRQRPVLQENQSGCILATHEGLGEYYFYFSGNHNLLFTQNDTNQQKVFGREDEEVFTKDAFHDAVIHGKNIDALIASKQGTKCAPVYSFSLDGHATETVYLRLSATQTDQPFPHDVEKIFSRRQQEADEFYAGVLPPGTSADMAAVRRQAFAGLLWSKQYYHYDVQRWLQTSDGISESAAARLGERNYDWKNVKAKDVLLMPDKWEYPWFAAWDLAFHCIPMAYIDPAYAKNQLLILLREWYMNPGGQVPAYEWNFGDVNPPVQAFAALRVYEIEKKATGIGDVQFLKKIFQKLIINFTWWVNRKDSNGNNVFEGGFLGLDNIGVFNRNMQLPGETGLEQTDGTSWMAMYALNMMDMAIEIARSDNAFEDTATKFYEHFVIISEALNELGLWDEQDSFFYDVLLLDGQDPFPLKLRSMVGLIPLFAVSVISKEDLERLPDFEKRLQWFTHYRAVNNLFQATKEEDAGNNILFSLVSRERLADLLSWALREDEFLSPGGVRALSKHYQNNPYRMNIAGEEYSIQYDPADSTSGLFGGNSNWRGPVWMPLNYLLVKAIDTYGDFYGEKFTIEFPVGSGQYCNLHQVGDMLRERLQSGFRLNDKNERAIHGSYNWFYQRKENRDLVLFYEYFDGDNRRGLGASHQTGWTALINDL